MIARAAGVLAIAIAAIGCPLDAMPIGDETESAGDDGSPTGSGPNTGDAGDADDADSDPGATSSLPGESDAGDAGNDAGGSTGSGTSAGPNTGDAGDADDLGSSGGSTGPILETCEDVLAAFYAETTAIRSCSEAQQCGQVLTGTSCGCTRNWVARLDADLEEWLALVELATQMRCELPFVSTCDCPEVDGFVCIDDACEWNYI